MPRLVLVFAERLVETRSEDWELIDSGAEAEIYQVRIKGRKYVAKVFTREHTKIAQPIERVMEMVWRLSQVTCGHKLPRPLYARGLPVALGSLEGRAVLLYEYIDGFRTLGEMISSPDVMEDYVAKHDQKERLAMACELLRALACLESADILHSDLTTANVAYGTYSGKHGFYVFDIETAALLGQPEYPLVVLPAKDAYLLPLTETLQQLGIKVREPSPTDLPLNITYTMHEPELRAWALRIMQWYGLQITSYIYLGVTLFHGLPSLTPSQWAEIVKREHENGLLPSWPPIAMIEAGYLSQREYTELAMLWKKLAPTIQPHLYKLYVEDLALRRIEPSVTLQDIVETLTC